MKNKGLKLLGIAVMVFIILFLPLAKKKLKDSELSGIVIKDPNISEVRFSGKMEGWEYSYSRHIGDYCYLDLKDPNGMVFEMLDYDDSRVLGDNREDNFKVGMGGPEIVFKKGHMMKQANKMFREWQVKIMERHWPEVLVKYGYTKTGQPENSGLADVNTPPS